jgi:hypothetical protein
MLGPASVQSERVPVALRFHRHVTFWAGPHRYLIGTSTLVPDLRRTQIGVQSDT